MFRYNLIYDISLEMSHLWMLISYIVKQNIWKKCRRELIQLMIYLVHVEVTLVYFWDTPCYNFLPSLVLCFTLSKEKILLEWLNTMNSNNIPRSHNFISISDSFMQTKNYNLQLLKRYLRLILNYK